MNYSINLPKYCETRMEQDGNTLTPYFICLGYLLSEKVFLSEFNTQCNYCNVFAPFSISPVSPMQVKWGDNGVESRIKLTQGNSFC